MKKLKCWKKGKYDSYHRKDGIELESYGQKTVYPFIQVGKYYDSKHGIHDGYEVMIHNIHSSRLLARKKTKRDATLFAQKYMKKHDN